MPRFFPISLLALWFWALPARAELVDLEILRREPFAAGKAYGDVGAYDRIIGVARFAVDPAHPTHRHIVDLDKAPRNAQGKVEFESDVFMLVPKDLTRGNRAIFYEVNNRGNKLALGMFNRAAAGNDPVTEAHGGDGFLLRRGYTVVWCGWIGEVLPGNSRMLLRAPMATEKGEPIRGQVRYEMVADKAEATLPLARREGLGSYPVTKRGEAEGTLTWREHETDERQLIPREQWSLERQPFPMVKQGIRSTLSQIRCRLQGGFKPGVIYELIAEAEGPIVQGLGYVATRDLLSFLRYDGSARNPLRLGDGTPAIERIHAFGVSQSGRFLRNYLYLSFNMDEQGRKVMDGVISHVAGGGLGFFNHRFAQPTRHDGQHEEHLYPTDYFPFTYGSEREPYTGREDSIYLRMDEKHRPKVMHTQSAAEYWHRSGSLVHTDPLGKADVEIPAGVRIYAFGGTQHGPAASPPTKGIGDNLMNPGDYRPLLRALLDALDGWVRDGIEPPVSRYPRIDAGTLVDWHQDSAGFPRIPGVRYPQVIQQPALLDHGPQFTSHGILSVQPPRKMGLYVVKVPRSGPDGNDLGCLLPPEVAVPLATYTGWNLRRKEAGADGMLVSLTGSYIPFARTRAERQSKGDPRPSIEERFASFQVYRDQFASACDALVRDRYLLPEDRQRLLGEREKLRDQFVKD